jgi:ADP-heptose:LPS heptosyltransferase
VPLGALAGPADGPAVEALLEDGALQEGALARDWPLPEIAALLSLARAVVGNDSGPTHLAAAVGCPTVALFGPTDPAVWAPPGAHVRVIARPAGGAPWADVERVMAALGPILAAPAAASVGEPVRAGGGPA